MIAVDHLFAAFFALCTIGGGIAFLIPDRRSAIALSLIASAAAVVVILASGVLLISGEPFRVELWSLISLGRLTLDADRLSALFIFVAGLVFLPVSVFSGAYLRKYLGHYDLRYFSALYHGLFATIVLVLIAGDAISFLIAWDLMSIISYLLVNYENQRDDSAHAGFIMLAMSAAGTVLATLALIILIGLANDISFTAMRSQSSAAGSYVGWVVFLLSFFGFAVKAGLVPVNSWLPLAHPVAPTNVSALLSGVIVNLGIYGIVRVNLDLLPTTTPVPGLIVLAIGSVSALIGILYATIQTEMKRLLAHSSIENMGIVAAGIGAGMVFASTGHQVIAGIAFIAALYHMTNHALYKALLFIGTGAVEAGAGTRDLDRLGGIIRHMPWTSAFFLVGVMSISALPPLNGFVSEWLTLQTMLRSAVLSSTPIKIVFAVSGAVLALTAGLAITCFVKAFAMGFLGMARSDGAANAREADMAFRAPMALLAAACLLLGVLPTYVIPVLDSAVSPLSGQSATDSLVPAFFAASLGDTHGMAPQFISEFHDLGAQIGAGIVPGRGLVVLHRGGESNPVVFAMSMSYTLVVLAILLLLVFSIFRLLTRRRAVARRAAWDGGLRRLRPEITYTATGFSNPVRVIFHAILRPATIEDTTTAVAQHFRAAIRREQTESHIVDRLLFWPLIDSLRWSASVLRRMHVGHVNAYAAYVLVTLLIVLAVGLGGL